MMERPLIYPKHLQGQVGDAAILFDVDDAPSLARCLDELDAVGVAERLDLRSRQATRLWRESQQVGVADLCHVMERFRARMGNFR